MCSIVDEIEFPFERATRFEDLETERRSDGRARPSCASTISKRSTGLIERYRRELGAAGIDYHLLETSQPLELALLAYLSTRSRDL